MVEIRVTPEAASAVRRRSKNASITKNANNALSKNAPFRRIMGRRKTVASASPALLYPRRSWTLANPGMIGAALSDRIDGM
jgi:hypothetical protein